MKHAAEHSPSSLPPAPEGAWQKLGWGLRLAPRMPFVWFMRFYRLVISPLYGPVCRYYPSCSKYALDAFEVTGAVRGTGLTIWRLLRCNPFSPGGVDHVPGSVLAQRSAQLQEQDQLQEQHEHTHHQQEGQQQQSEHRRASAGRRLAEHRSLDRRRPPGRPGSSGA